MTCRKCFISDVWQSFEFAFVAIDYFRKSVGYLFTKFDYYIPPYIKQYSIVQDQIHVTLCSTYLLLNNKNYDTCFPAMCFYRLWYNVGNLILH